MNKVEQLRATLRPFLEDVLAGQNPRMLVHHLTVNSNLPGAQANLELAQALADEMGERVPARGAVLWGLVATWADIRAEQAPTGNPREYLPFCAMLGIAAMGAASEMWWLSALDRLRNMANDPRTLVREGVVLGLRRMLDTDFLPVADELVGWIEGGNPGEMRVVAEALSEPVLLTEEAYAVAALAIHRALIDTYILLPLAWRDQPDCRALRDALSTSLSVAVAAAPEPGFDDIRRWAARHDPDLDWLLVQNLSQARLMSVFQVETETILKLLRP